MNKAPAFQFYPQDWLASAKVAEMTLEEEGAYIRLLCYCWMTGSIPADPARCAKMVGKGCTVEVAATVQRAFNQISTTLQPDGNQTSTNDQRMTHERLEKEREKQARHREKSSFGGRQSAKSRSAKSMTATTKNHPSTTLQPNVNLSSSTSVEDGCVFESQNLPVTGLGFEGFWKVYPRKIARGAAEKAWKAAIKHTSEQTIIDAAKRFATAMVDQEKTFIKHPATWLNGKCWLDELPPPAEKVCRWPYDDTDIHTPEGMALLTKTFLENQHRA